MFSVSHRCNDDKWEKPWYISWIFPFVHTKTFKSAYLDASQYWGEAFYHAIQEKGFMLGAARVLLTQSPEMVIIVELLPPKLEEFAEEILGISKTRFHVMSFAILVQKLYVPYGADCAVQSSQHTLLTREWIRDRHPRLYKISHHPTDIVIINRNEGGVCNRCLRNSGELRVAVRKRYPLRTVHLVTLGDMRYVQVMELFAKTDIVIAPHGAGLVHMVFLPNGLEILNKRNQCNFCFYELSLGLGLQYKAISPLKIGPSTVNFERVNIENVLAAVEGMIKAQH
jgi:capsular polysaccharide biosynthesis protein